MTDSKIQGKFYPLQHEEWLRACRELTKLALAQATCSKLGIILCFELVEGGDA